MRRLLVAAVMAATLAIAAPAYAHHPEIIAAECRVDGADIVIDWTVAAWDTDDPLRRTTPDQSVVVTADGGEVGRGEFNEDNGYTFTGSFPTAAGSVVLRVTATEGFYTPEDGLAGAGEFREVTVVVDCEVEPPVEEPPPPVEPPVVTTTTTVPPVDLNIDLEIMCDNRDAATGVHEPIITYWSGDYDQFDHEVFFEVEYPIGTWYGGIEPFGLTTPRMHDSWVSDSSKPVPDGVFLVRLYLDGEVYREVTADCSVPVAETTTTTTVEPPRVPVCIETDAGWVVDYGPRAGDECLPFTGFSTTQVLIATGIVFLLALALLVFEARQLGWKGLHR